MSFLCSSKIFFVSPSIMKILNNIAKMLLITLIVIFSHSSLYLFMESVHLSLVNLYSLTTYEKNNLINNSILFKFQDQSLLYDLILQNVCMHLHFYIFRIQLFHIPYKSKYRFFIYNHHNVHVFKIYDVINNQLNTIVFYGHLLVFGVIIIFDK